MAAAYPENVFTDPGAWPRARRLDALALELVRASVPPKGGEGPAAAILNALGQYRQESLGAYSDALPLFKSALEIREKALGTEHPDTASSLNNLAALLLA